jgi:rubrerythrin
MRTSQEWWAETKADSSKLLRWLKNQYHGEATAAMRINQFLAAYAEQAPNHKQVETIRKIAGQEERHAAWISELLQSRGVEAAILEKRERYWDQTLGGIQSFVTGCAVAAHAERMRLDRIRAIVSDAAAPADIRAVFKKILRQEEFHERAFRAFAGHAAMEATREHHEAGARSLGLVP